MYSRGAIKRPCPSQGCKNLYTTSLSRQFSSTICASSGFAMAETKGHQYVCPFKNYHFYTDFIRYCQYLKKKF